MPLILVETGFFFSFLKPCWRSSAKLRFFFLGAGKTKPFSALGKGPGVWISHQRMWSYSLKGPENLGTLKIPSPHHRENQKLCASHNDLGLIGGIERGSLF